ncbi:MAG TPA: type 2 isopentenyl-diphosphate Delta-isomerase [Ignavibacteriales bacterium]|nr:type 2 isopentenyl-diphosphate Delta-isomerase [Ignavibacteriales bacterium]
MEPLDNIQNRKIDHIKICVTEDVDYKDQNTFDLYQFEHNALPELNYDEIDQSIEFWGRRFSYPLLLSSMTGGNELAKNINFDLGLLANELNIPIAVGSQRPALENPELIETYSIVRKKFPNLFLIGNIGAAQLVKNDFTIDKIHKIVEMIEANAVYIHTNPLQELFQKNGDLGFKGILKQIEIIVKEVEIPILVKEVGAGINKEVAEKLLNVGVSGIDVAGASGTNWAKVEMIRNKKVNDNFINWGLPTTYCIKEIAKLKSKYNFTLIGSGGIDNGIKIAKAIALGADFTGSAKAIIKSIYDNGVEFTYRTILEWMEDLKRVQFLTSSKNINELKNAKLITKMELY